MKKIVVSIPNGVIGVACNAIVQAYNTHTDRPPVEVDLWSDPYELIDKNERVILAGRNVTLDNIKECESSKTDVVIFDNSYFDTSTKNYIKRVVSRDSIFNPNVPIPTMLYSYFSGIIFRKNFNPDVIDQWHRVGIAVREMSDYLDGKDVYFDKFEDLTKPSMRGIYLHAFQMIDWLGVKSDQFDQLLLTDKDPGTSPEFTEAINATYSAIAAENELFCSNIFTISPFEYDLGIYATVCQFELKHDKFIVGRHFKSRPHIKFVIDFNVLSSRIRIWHNPADTNGSAYGLAERWKSKSIEAEVQCHPSGNFAQIYGSGAREIILQEILTKYVEG